MMNITLKGAAGFHQLGRRKNQEDSRWPESDSVAADCRWFAVCDGVGGCDKGEVASATVAAALAQYMDAHFNSDTVFTADDFSYALAYAYKALEAAATPENAGMATTLTFVAFHAGGVLAAHIGDSRIYQLRPDTGVIYRSEDHSLVQAMVKSGNISADEAVNHRLGNVITRCMSADGSRCEATVVMIDDVMPGDFFFLCSDGVLHMIDDARLAEIISAPDTLEDKVALMAQLSQDSSDNNTAFLVEVENVETPVETIVIDDIEDNDSTTKIIKRAVPFSADIAPDEVPVAESMADPEPLQDESEPEEEIEPAKEEPKKRSFFSKLFGG